MRGWNAVAGHELGMGKNRPCRISPDPRMTKALAPRTPRGTTAQVIPTLLSLARLRLPLLWCAVGNKTADCHNLKLTELRDDNCRCVTVMNQRLHKTKSVSYALRSRELNAVVLIFNHYNI
jgi:hypothetical protein